MRHREGLQCLLFGKGFSPPCLFSPETGTGPQGEGGDKDSGYSWMVRGEAGTCEWLLKLGQFCGGSSVG